MRTDDAIIFGAFGDRGGSCREQREQMDDPKLDGVEIEIEQRIEGAGRGADSHDVATPGLAPNGRRGPRESRVAERPARGEGGCRKCCLITVSATIGMDNMCCRLAGIERRPA